MRLYLQIIHLEKYLKRKEAATKSLFTKQVSYSCDQNPCKTAANEHLPQKSYRLEACNFTKSEVPHSHFLGLLTTVTKLFYLAADWSIF